MGVALICTVVLVVWLLPIRHGTGTPSASLASDALSHSDVRRGDVPPAMDPDLAYAREAVASMGMDERIGQLIMVPLCSGCDVTTVARTVNDTHAGSILVTGTWNAGTASVRQAVEHVSSSAVSDAASPQLLVATDQEGGTVQHLRGEGFSAMPTPVEQGTLSAQELRAQAGKWGSELAQAGITTDLAPVVDTLGIERTSNAPIGALSRDFGLDATGNALHAQAFMQGMADTGIATVIKHFPGLGAVTGNTDFTAQGIVDTSTGVDSPQLAAFRQALDSQPSMVMMSLATYTLLDPHAPAAFSPVIVNQLLRGRYGYRNVVISDSLSAQAVSSIDATQLGVRFVEAGGDIACIGESSLVAPIVAGLRTRSSQDADFAHTVTTAATRVMALKHRMGLTD